MGEQLTRYLRSFAHSLDLDDNQLELRDRIATYDELKETLKVKDEEFGIFVDGFPGLPHTDPKIMQMVKSGNYDFYLRATPIIKTVEQGVEIDSIPCSMPVSFGTPGKYYNVLRKDLWAATIYTLPYLEPLRKAGVNPPKYTTNYNNPRMYLGRNLFHPQNPKLNGYECIGNRQYLIDHKQRHMPTDCINEAKLTSTYTFQHYPNDDLFPITIFENLDHLVDLIYSLSFDFINGMHQYNEMYPNTPIVGQTELEKQSSMILKRRPIIIYCAADKGFRNKEDIHTNSSYPRVEDDPTTHGNYVPFWNSFTMDKKEIKDFLIQQNFTPEFFKKYGGRVARRIVIDVYREIGKPSYPLFTECCVVGFKDELPFHFNNSNTWIYGTDNMLNDYIDITKDITLTDFDPKIGDKAKFEISELKGNDFLIRSYPTYLENINSIGSKMVKDNNNTEGAINCCVGSLALRLQQFKANFDYFGLIPFRACTELSLLGYKGQFVHREEGYKKGQEVVHPITGDLYLCIKDRPGIKNKENFNIDTYETTEHNYPVDNPTYTVLDDTEYFKKIFNFDYQDVNTTRLACTEEEYKYFYRSGLPTYTALLSYLNLLIPAHEGLIVPPIDPSLFRFNKSNGEPLAINDQSYISYYRIFPHLNGNTIADLSGMVKKGLKYKNNENDKGNANYTTDLEEFDIENTTFPYHYLDAYFNRTSGDNMFGMEDLDSVENIEEFESKNAIEDALFGAWHKFRNKNSNRIIYVSSRPVFWTRDVQLILGANFLHPRGHHIRVGKNWYWVRLLTDKAYLNDEPAQDNRACNLANNEAYGLEYNLLNNPIPINWHESLIDSTILALCDLVGGNTSICKRNIPFRNINYSYPANSTEPLFSLNNLAYKFKDLGVVVSPFIETDYSNLSIAEISTCLRFMHTNFMSGKKYGVNGNLYYRADVASYPYINVDYRETLGVFDHSDTPRVGKYDSNDYGNNPQLDYNLQISNKLKLAPSMTGWSSNLRFITNGFCIPKPSSYFYQQGKETEYRKLKILRMFDLGYGLHNEEDNKYGNHKSGVVFKSLGVENSLGANAYKKFPTLVGNKFIAPNNVSYYIPVHIVLEPIEEKEAPFQRNKMDMHRLQSAGIEETGRQPIGENYTHNKLFNPAAGIDLNAHKNKMAEAMFNSYLHRKVLTMGLNGNEALLDRKQMAIKTVQAHPFAIGWLKWARYGGPNNKSYDIDYILRTPLLKDMVNYTPVKDSPTPDTYYNGDGMTSFVGANRILYGSYNLKEWENGSWGGYNFIEDSVSPFGGVLNGTGSRLTAHGESNSKLLRDDRWSGSFFITEFSPASRIGSINARISPNQYLFSQLSSILRFVNNNQGETNINRKQYNNPFTIYCYYFKGKILAAIQDSNFVGYDTDHYGLFYTKDMDHVETGRGKPFDAADKFPRRVKWIRSVWDVTMPWLSNDRSMHSNQGLERKVYPISEYMDFNGRKPEIRAVSYAQHCWLPLYIESVSANGTVRIWGQGFIDSYNRVPRRVNHRRDENVITHPARSWYNSNWDNRWGVLMWAATYITRDSPWTRSMETIQLPTGEAFKLSIPMYWNKIRNDSGVYRWTTNNIGKDIRWAHVW